MDVNKICYNCLTENVRNGICRKCGFKNNEYRYSGDHLPPLTGLNGKYLVGRVLKENEISITYAAVDVNLNVDIVIKELYLQNKSYRDHTRAVYVTAFDKLLLEENKKRFLQEARVMAAFSEKENEGIIKVKEYFEENNTAYVVMEKLKGITLKQRLKHGVLNYDTIVKVMSGVSTALTKIHAGGAVHLEINPENILITKNNDIKLLDFGGMKSIPGDGNSGKAGKFTPFEAPEQSTANGNIGPWTDVFSFASTIYTCLTGLIAEPEMKKPSDINVKIPENAESTLMKALNRQPEERFRTIEEFWREFTKVEKSHKKLIGLICGAAVLVAAAVSYFCFFMPQKAGDVITNITGNNIIKTAVDTGDKEYRMSVLHNDEENSLFLLEKQKDEAQVFVFAKQAKSKYKIYTGYNRSGSKQCISYDSELCTVGIKNENDTEEQLFSLIYVEEGVYQIQTYDGMVLGFDINENGNYNGRLIVSRDKEQFQDEKYTEWLISETYIK